VDSLAEALGGAFPLGAVRGVLLQCGGDAGRCVCVRVGVGGWGGVGRIGVIEWMGWVID
jgi:hypothetical protein